MLKINQLSKINKSIVGILLLFPWAASLAADIPTLTEAEVISGTVEIAFHTRANKDNSGKLAKDSPAKGTKDEYKIALKVAKTTEFAGQVERQPRLFSKLLGQEVQPAQLDYNLELTVLNPLDPSQKKKVGKWIGLVPINEKGVYDFSGGNKPLRIVVDTVGKAPGFEDAFSGKLRGKAQNKESLLNQASTQFTRWIGKQEVKLEVKNVDPMSFDNLILAAGPAQSYPRTVVNGRLDFDYDTGNWLTSGITFKYNLEGVAYEDVVTGSVKWEEEADRKTTGKGHYTFNLRFNEAKQATATDEKAAFDTSKLSAEEAFFAVDDSIPALTGRVDYVDTIDPAKGESPIASKVSYDLKANKLTKQQIMNFFKLWMVAIGPTNDE